jgi:two-component system sensor histidine kinase/response regulator
MSKEGKGSVAPSQDVHQQIRFNARILVAEDNTTNQLVAQCLLKRFGIQADITANGEEAIKALETLRYDLVLMDCQMPVLDGYDATKRIRDIHSNVLDHNIPIIAMTANVLQGDKEKCLLAGMNDFIPKPVKFDKVLQVLQQWLPKNEAHSEPETMIFDAVTMRQRLMNDDDLIRRVIETFSRDMELQIKLLKTAIADKDFVIVAAQAHTINGAAANVSGLSLSALASIIEDASKAEDLEKLLEMLPKIERDFILLKANMDAIL